jgi:hypothetical protein
MSMSGLDRVRPRTGAAAPTTGSEIRDADGKRALFSTAVPQSSPAFGSVSVNCASCGEVSALSARQAIKMALPSLHLPFVRRDNPSYVRCPACGKFSWARVSVHL